MRSEVCVRACVFKFGRLQRLVHAQSDCDRTQDGTQKRHSLPYFLGLSDHAHVPAVTRIYLEENGGVASCFFSTEFVLDIFIFLLPSYIFDFFFVFVRPGVYFWQRQYSNVHKAMITGSCHAL